MEINMTESKVTESKVTEVKVTATKTEAKVATTKTEAKEEMNYFVRFGGLRDDERRGAVRIQNLEVPCAAEVHQRSCIKINCMPRGLLARLIG
ncbi:hypothetical protein BC936DRAFT_144513 [Jimgerdemannia flammicorona]|uniref:Uncharacterized protein n=1 Tax=Jimgerdemannia flammicorona TaxID=994334 RepID=A0A433DCB1_9FUNG|nr:hypothetical protein BC936DRAFT_144513 [Jimgerdemannia flammicorona]